MASCLVDLRQRCANFGMDATVVSAAVSVDGMLGATVDFKDVDAELDLRTALIVGVNAEALPATAVKIATRFTQVVENFIVVSYII